MDAITKRHRSLVMSNPDFVEPYPGYFKETNKGPVVVPVVGTMTAIAGLFVAARIYSRIISLGKLAVDDYIVILGVLLNITYVAIAAVALKYGGTRHTDALSPEDLHKAIYYTVVAWVPTILSFVVPKYAVIILLARILDPSPWHRRCMWVVMIIYFLQTVVLLVINFVQCEPVSAQWDGPLSQCWDRRIILGYALAHGIVSLLIDFYMAIYPTIILSRLLFNWKKKLALSSALGFGYCAGAVTCYKCYTLVSLLDLMDFTYAVGDLMLWGGIEAACVLIGACIPTLFPLAKKFFGASVLSSSGRSAPKDGQKSAIRTIGSYPKNKKRPKRSVLGLTDLDTVNDMDTVKEMDTVNDNNKYITLEEGAFRASIAEDEWGKETIAAAARASKDVG